MQITVCNNLYSSQSVSLLDSLKIIFIPLASFLEKAMAPHSSTLAWKIPWMQEPGRLQSVGSLRIRHDVWNIITDLKAILKKRKTVSLSSLHTFKKILHTYFKLGTIILSLSLCRSAVVQKKKGWVNTRMERVQALESDRTWVQIPPPHCDFGHLTQLFWTSFSHLPIWKW